MKSLALWLHAVWLFLWLLTVCLVFTPAGNEFVYLIFLMVMEVRS